MTLRCDIAILGGGIVGLATAWRLAQALPERRLLVIEKENAVARHQTGRNSGVLHTGIYYKPGSAKALNCRAGKVAMERFCTDYGIAFERCGKVIVATRADESPLLERLLARGRENGVVCESIGPERLRELEPHVAGLHAIHVPEAGIVDYVGVCTTLVRLLGELGHRVLLATRVEQIARDSSGRVRLLTSGDEIDAGFLVNCAGLHSDRIAKRSGVAFDAQIVPFRGEYFELDPRRQALCRNLIYPVPDPQFPFLGVHFTRMVKGGVECGPNAVLAFAREGYAKLHVDLGDLVETLTYPGFLRLAAKHWRTGSGEMWRSFSKRAFTKALQRLIPEIRAEDLRPAESGIRAQAVARDGSLVDDFKIEEQEFAIHVLNAPSPAATAALNIGQVVAERVAARTR
ncbi:MAG: L-2-hydroxyglutarate oxidase [Planctomycetes bacterium]|nr:L-2-hydroxyglutarate oxidase [Planctomycetota bacterium]MCC7171106.1 L-2-hydroxyglutarate oxidase [Planctomycetota bacterium]